MFRVPIPSLVAFPEEKTRAEVAAMLHVAKHTAIRVPRVYHWGTAADNPTGLDLPFMIIEFIPHAYDLGTLLAEPGLVQRPDLKGDASLIKEYLFRQLANMHIQLSQLQCQSISALDVIGDRTVLSGAPKTFLLNNQIISYHVPQAVFTPNITTPIPSSRQWFISIAEKYIAGLLYDEDPNREAEEIRSMFVARYLFRQLAQQRKLPQNPDDELCSTGGKSETFRLWCDDFRPHNMLCNENGEVQGVIDWEFVYFAPESYIYDPPYWLFIDRDPEEELSDNGDDDSVEEQGITGIAEDDAESQEQDEHTENISEEAKQNRSDFNLDEDVESNRQLFMRALQLEERALHDSRRRASLASQKGITQSRNQSEEGLAEQLSGLNIPDGDTTLTPLYDRMTKRWEEQRNEFVWNFTYRWDREEFDAWYWDELDQEHDGKSGNYQDRLDLLPQHAKDLMEWFVHKRVEERNQWDPRKLMEAVLGQMDGKEPLVTVVDRI